MKKLRKSSICIFNKEFISQLFLLVKFSFIYDNSGMESTRFSTVIVFIISTVEIFLSLLFFVAILISLSLVFSLNSRNWSRL